MNIFLMDLENVGLKSFRGLEKLSEKDEVLMFYSNPHIIPNIKEEINRVKPLAKMQFIEVLTGTKNALDFQLVSTMGELIEKYKEDKDTTYFYIVSKDNGFDILEEFYDRKDVEVITVDNLAKEIIGTDAIKR